MKRKFFAFILLITAGLSLASCLSSDDDTNIEYTHDTAITAFSLGDMTRYYSGKSTSTGKDTTFSATVTGTNYKFVIDQTKREIYNLDSLPVGTKTSAVLVTATAKQSSPLVWVLTNKDGADSLAYYSSSDSVDLSSPKKLRVYNNDYSAYATYTVTANVHKENVDSFVWRSLASQNADLEALQNLKVLSAGSNIYVFGKGEAGLKIYKSSNLDGSSWTEIVPQVALDEEAYKSAIVKDENLYDETLYILSNGTIYKSTDAKNWDAVTTDASLYQLIGASSQCMYAYTATGSTISGIAVSLDNGVTWTPEVLDNEASLLPTENLSLVISSVRSTKNAENLLLVGNRAEAKNDTIATLWNRTVDYNEGAKNGQWNYVEYDAHQGGKLPYLNTLQVARNDSGFVALGAGKYGDSYKGKWYKSKNGLTWNVDTTVVMPAGLYVNMPMGFVRDANNYYWIINNGYVWKGRYNRDGWRKD